MGWIKRRINKEKSKHEGRLDWSLSAEKKIISQLNSIIEGMEDKFSNQDYYFNNWKEFFEELKQRILGGKK